MLIVFDDTQADKLDELIRNFEEAGGEAYVGSVAWQHLQELSGETMAVFVEKYVRQPLANLLAAVPDRNAPPTLSLSQTADAIVITIDGEEWRILRPDLAGAREVASDDADAMEALVEEHGLLEEPLPPQLNLDFTAINE